MLADYAGRAVLRGLSEPARRAGVTTFTMTWHHGLRFRLAVDPARRVVSFPALLPGVPARSEMFAALEAFLREFASPRVPVHRRIDAARAGLRLTSRGGRVSLTLGVKAGEWEYATRRLMHLAHEVFMVFLPDGPYLDYRVEHLGLDPETVWA